MSYWNERKCQMCGKAIEHHRRYDAKFCDANCRKAYSRRRDKITNGFSATMSGLADLRHVAKKHEDLRPEVIEKLRYLQQEIRDILYMAGDKEEMARVAMLNDRANKQA